jgi:hypothetical protein
MFEDIIALDPVHFFAFQIDCKLVGKQFDKHHLLPHLMNERSLSSNLSPFGASETSQQRSAKFFKSKKNPPTLQGSVLHGRPWAEVFIGWEKKGIRLLICVDGHFHEAQYPNLMEGDSIELFFDTRDVKTAGYPTRFCHHFFFLPERIPYDGGAIQAGEMTRFRSDERHELCDPSLLNIEVVKEKKETHVHIFIPSECLYGYDPNLFDRLGFTYRFNRSNGMKQYFSVTDTDFSIENQPSLWASLKLVNR